MELTNETEAKIFAQYLGQNIVYITQKHIFTGITKQGQVSASGMTFNTNEIKLLLTPLSDISDEDAIEVAKIIGFAKHSEHNGKVFIKDVFIDKKASSLSFHSLYGIDVYQYLQSRGYDLPNYLLGGKTLIEAGLAVNKNTLNK